MSDQRGKSEHVRVHHMRHVVSDCSVMSIHSIYDSNRVVGLSSLVGFCFSCRHSKVLDSHWMNEYKYTEFDSLFMSTYNPLESSFWSFRTLNFSN